MDSALDAVQKFRELGFTNVVYTSMVPPFNEQAEIARIYDVLKDADSVERKLYEEDLRMQLDGEPEKVIAFKSFRSFDGMSWTTDRRPYIQGTFEQVYTFLFFVRQFEGRESDPSLFMKITSADAKCGYDSLLKAMAALGYANGKEYMSLSERNQLV
jgi:hypothetical protein